MRGLPLADPLLSINSGCKLKFFWIERFNENYVLMTALSTTALAPAWHRNNVPGGGRAREREKTWTSKLSALQYSRNGIGRPYLRLSPDLDSMIIASPAVIEFGHAIPSPATPDDRLRLGFCLHPFADPAAFRRPGPKRLRRCIPIHPVGRGALVEAEGNPVQFSNAAFRRSCELKSRYAMPSIKIFKVADVRAIKVLPPPSHQHRR
jgi:hypothetical protein